MNVVETLQDRGFIEQATHDTELNEYVEGNDVTCYIGFDPTASSLHVGSLVPIMSLAHMQRHGHRPIALVGGGTGLIGDPSGKTEMRKMLTNEAIEENMEGIRGQLSRFIDFSDGKAIMVNNADWLTKLEYIPFLRDIGKHFSINRMIKAESYKIRLESEEGLSFIEFNYMLLQAYDFMKLFKQYGCHLQMGGRDQWGNIVAGVELVRRMCQETAFGITFPLVTTSSGEKMGKTAKGAVWLDAERTSPYDYFQFWVNTDDRDVVRFLSLFTFLPMDEIRKVKDLTDADLNTAKAILAFEATTLAHGEEKAVNAFRAAEIMFGSRKLPADLLPSSCIPREGSESDDASVPHSEVDMEVLTAGIPAFKVFQITGLSQSGGAARRLIQQGGAYVNGNRITSFDYLVTDKDLSDGEIVLRAGKKQFHKLKVK
ncbi:MAG: tyrosine--tRNA ligase [Desulfobacterales bacterium]|nr:tyrosine--tRNA ligase [Desulfobacterales bacterium]